MTITVDWARAAPWMITIPKSDLTLESGTKYNLDVVVFWQLLRDFSDSPEAIPNPVLYTRIAATASTPSITEIDMTYYSLEFEDGTYSVNVINGNTNIRDVEIKNQVSVNTNNTTGFIDPTFLESGLFDGYVCIDEINGVSGTGKTGDGNVIGTRSAPSNNQTDAMAITMDRSFYALKMIGSGTLTGVPGSLDNYRIKGDNRSQSVITFINADTGDASIEHCRFTGDMNGALHANGCDVDTIIKVGCTSNESNFINCTISGSITLRSDNTRVINLTNCDSGVAGVMTPFIDVNGTVGDILVHHWKGGLEFRNITSNINVTFDSPGGKIIIDSSCTTGTIVVRGSTYIDDNSGVGCTIVDQTTQTSTWGVSASNLVSGSFGEIVVNLIKYQSNKTLIDETAFTLTIMEDDGVTPFKVFDLQDSAGAQSVTEIFRRIPQ